MRRVACVAFFELPLELGKKGPGERLLEQKRRSSLMSVAEAALAFGPVVAFDVVQNLVWLETGGCAHLHGGEECLATTLRDAFGAWGLRCRVAIADGPRLAAAVARFADAAGPHREGLFLISTERGAEAIRGLPIEALSLGGDI